MKGFDISEERRKEIISEVIEKLIIEQGPALTSKVSTGPIGAAAVTKTPNQTQATVAPRPAPMAKPKPKTTIVNFDSETDSPFTVKFSERGFSIGGTRLSFETLHNALSKGYNIVLDSGQGLDLTPVRMQKILKHEDRY